MRHRRYRERLKSPSYTPNRLLNHVAAALDIRLDCHLARFLGISRYDLSRMRRRVRYIDAELMLKIHDATGLSIADIRDLMGETCEP